MSDYEYEDAQEVHVSGPAPNSSMALISLVAGILGLTILPGVASIVAIVTGHMAKREIRDSGGTLGGDGLATGGLILGYISVAMAVLLICFVIGIFVFVLLVTATTATVSGALPLVPGLW